jgi:hypothetical protein
MESLRVETLSGECVWSGKISDFPVYKFGPEYRYRVDNHRKDYLEMLESRIDSIRLNYRFCEKLFIFDQFKSGKHFNTHSD